MLLTTASLLAIVAGPAWATSPAIKLTPLGSSRIEVAPGVCRQGVAQIGAYDFLSHRLFVTNSSDRTLERLNISDPTHPVRLTPIPVPSNFEPPGVAAAFGLVALAIEAITPESANGRILLLDHNGNLLRDFDALGSGPERIAFSPDGRFIVAAVQGEQDNADASDPEGGVTIIDLARGIQRAGPQFADFSRFSSTRLVRRGVRMGPDPTDPTRMRLNPAVKDLEPHGITVGPDSRTAFVTLQHNNALAVVDLPSHTVTAVLPFGLKDHHLPGNGLDPSKADGKIDFEEPWPVWGAYMPDGIASFSEHFQTFLVTANEGDTRNLLTPNAGGGTQGQSDAIQLDGNEGPVTLDPVTFPNAATLIADTALGGLEISNLRNDALPNASGQYTRLVSLGGRSISIWTTYGRLIYDSGDQLEKITSDPALYPGTNFFNTTDDGNKFDDRSPRRGPQPQDVAVGRIGGRVYAFVGLRKQGGIIIADLTDAPASVPLGYESTRDFTQDPLGGIAKENKKTQINCTLNPPPHQPDQSDLGPEGLLFIPKLLSPNGHPLLVVNYDVSGSTRIYQVDPAQP